MDVFKAIEKRHSYRGSFKKRTISEKELVRIVEAGIRAPSGYNDQTTSFVMVNDKNILGQIGDIMNNRQVREAPAAIVICMDTVGAKRQFNFGIEDYSAAVENILLAVTSLGYATVWIDGSLRSEGRAGKISGLLGVPDTHEVRVVLPLGEPTETGNQKERKNFEDRAWFNRFGG